MSTLPNMKAYISSRLTLESFKEPFIIIAVSFGLGLGMSIFDNYEVYIVGISISVGTMISCFLVFIVPKIAGMFKHELDDDSISKKLCRGRDGSPVKLKSKLELQDIRL